MFHFVPHSLNFPFIIPFVFLRISHYIHFSLIIFIFFFIIIPFRAMKVNIFYQWFSTPCHCYFAICRNTVWEKRIDSYIIIFPSCSSILGYSLQTLNPCSRQYRPVYWMNTINSFSYSIDHDIFLYRMKMKMDKKKEERRKNKSLNVFNISWEYFVFIFSTHNVY